MDDAVHDDDRGFSPGFFDPVSFDVSFSLFTTTLGEQVYRKLTGGSPDNLQGWDGLRAALISYGQRDEQRIAAVRERGLDALDFFSSSEALVAVVMLRVADRGREAQEAANRIEWWLTFDRVADTRTRYLLAKLLTM